jgi:hypothetical protein
MARVILVDGKWSFETDDMLRALVAAARHERVRFLARRRADPAVDDALTKAEALCRSFGLPLTPDRATTSLAFEDRAVSPLVCRIAAAAAWACPHADGGALEPSSEAEEAVIAAHGPSIARLERELADRRLQAMRELLVSARPELDGATVSQDLVVLAGWKAPVTRL